jgi:hypothetical protein
VNASVLWTKAAAPDGMSGQPKPLQ